MGILTSTEAKQIKAKDSSDFDFLSSQIKNMSPKAKENFIRQIGEKELLSMLKEQDLENMLSVIRKEKTERRELIVNNSYPLIFLSKKDVEEIFSESLEELENFLKENAFVMLAPALQSKNLISKNILLKGQTENDRDISIDDTIILLNLSKLVTSNEDKNMLNLLFSNFNSLNELT